MHWNLGLRWSLLIVPLAILCPARAAGPSDDPPPPQIREQVAVQLVQVSFLATDRSGRPVTDLRAEEIEILERGKPQKVAFLEPYYRPVATGATALPPAGLGKAAPASPHRWVVLLLDAYTSSSRTRVRSLEAIRSFVEGQLGPQDRAAIAVFHGKLDLLQTFTSDRALLLRAASLSGSRLEHAADDRTRSINDLLEGMESCRSQGSQQSSCAQRLAAEYENARLREARDIVYALTTLSRALAPIPDLKAVVFFSDGFSHDPFADAFDAARQSLGFETARRLSANASGRLDRDLNELVSAASASQVSFFTIYPGGGAGQSAVSATRGGVPSERSNPENIDVYRRSEQNFGQGLIELARRTGGHWSQGNDVLKQLTSTWQLASGLYTAGYYLSDYQASRSGEIRIRCRRKGVVLESRREAPMAQLDGGLLAELEASSDACDAGSRRLARLSVSIDPATIAYVREENGQHADVSVYLSVLDPTTQISLWEDYRFLRLSEDQGASPQPRERPRIEHTLRVPCRPLSIRAFVVDVRAGRRAELSADLPP